MPGVYIATQGERRRDRLGGIQLSAIQEEMLVTLSPPRTSRLTQSESKLTNKPRAFAISSVHQSIVVHRQYNQQGIFVARLGTPICGLWDFCSIGQAKINKPGGGRGLFSECRIRGSVNIGDTVLIACASIREGPDVGLSPCLNSQGVREVCRCI